MVPIILTLLIVTIFCVVFAPDVLEHCQMEKKRKTELEAAKPLEGLSDVAKHLYAEYMELPVEARPWDTIIPALRGLDEATACDAETRNAHYDANADMRIYAMINVGWSAEKAVDVYPYAFVWEADTLYTRACAKKIYPHRQPCEFHAYRDLHDEIAQVAREYADTRRKLEKAENEHKREAAAELLQALRDEKQIQREVRGELG